MDKLYDLTPLAEMLEGDEKEIRVMVEMFVNITPQVAGELKDAADRKEWVKAGDIAHKIKSSLKMMGIFDIAEEALFIEKSGRTGENVDVLASKINELVRELNVVVEQMKTDFGF
jgi:HPt (histidine-containing phosphotransfer) domain-containing protein